MDVPLIRSADEQDFDALCRLYVDFHGFHVRGVPDRLRGLDDPERNEYPRIKDTLGQIIGADDSAILVAELGGEVLGLAEVYLKADDRTNSYIVPYTYGFVQSLMVEEAGRHHGIGTHLLEAAQQWAQAKGATEIRLDAWEFDAGPLHFYEKCGYRTLKRTLVKNV
jgi:GNAT superfamily N-acetyltransferase